MLLSVIGGIMAGSALLAQHVLLKKQHKELAQLMSGQETVPEPVEADEEPIFPHLKVIKGGKKNGDSKGE